MAKRGRKKREIVGPGLPAEPPADCCLTTRGKKIYRDLATRLSEAGYARKPDTNAVAMTAAALDLLRRLQDELGHLPSLVDADGQPVGLLRELRQQNILVQSLLGSLLLTPRSRSSSRMSKDTILGQNQKTAAEDRADILRIIDGS
jgi:DNA transposition AAA+ family ATPase